MAEKILFFRRQTVKISAIILVALILLFAAMLSVILRTVKTQNIKTNNNMSENIVQGRADEIQNWFDIYKNDLRIYSDADVNLTGDDQQVITWLQAHQNLRNKDYDYMFFCDKEGTSVRDTGLVGSKGALTTRDYYIAMMTQNKSDFIGKMILSKTSGQYVVPIARPAKDKNGKTFGFWVGMVGFKTLSDKISSFKVGETGIFFLLDTEGMIVAHPDETLFMQDGNANPAIAELLKSKTTSMTRTENNGVAQYLYSSPVGNSGFTLVLQIDEKEVLSSITYIRQITIIFGIIIGIVTFILFFVCLMRIFKRIGRVSDLIEEMSTGEADLTIQLEIKKHDEIDTLLIAVNKLLAKFRGIITTIKNSTDDLTKAGETLAQEISATTSTIGQMSGNIKSVNGQVQEQGNMIESTSASVTEISKNIESLDAMIQDQSSCVVQASAAVEQMLGNINAVDKSVQSMSGEFKILEEDTKTGIDQNSMVASLLQKIADQSSSMVDANLTIQNIAEQTNLLAMNAAIEAAHAGESGKGFSVVADEIRKLAETSAEQSTKIGQELNNIQGGIEQVVNASTESEKSFSAVSNRIASTGELITQIKAAMEEQQSGSKQILDALQQMNNSTTEVKGAAQEMTKGGEMMMKDITNMNSSMQEVTSAVDEINTGTDYVNNSTSSLKEIASTLENSITQIKNDVDLFKV